MKRAEFAPKFGLVIHTVLLLLAESSCELIIEMTDRALHCSGCRRVYDVDHCAALRRSCGYSRSRSSSKCFRFGGFRREGFVGCICLQQVALTNHDGFGPALAVSVFQTRAVNQCLQLRVQLSESYRSLLRLRGEWCERGRLLAPHVRRCLQPPIAAGCADGRLLVPGLKGDSHRR